MIEVLGLTKIYGTNVAIKDLHFDARKGEILGFLGPNGAGKTTTMRILTGFMPPTEGTARIFGFDVVEDSLEVRKRVGYLPETVPLYRDMRTREYLQYMGSLHGVSDLDERVEAVMEEVNISDRAESYIGSLSKGLRQRVGLGQALIHEPQVLILDEPTIGLDPAQIIEVRNLIQELGKDRTVLLSTHILSEAQQVCDRVLIIDDGKIVAEDTPANLQAELAGAEKLLLRAAADTSELVQLLTGVGGVVSVQAGSIEGEIVVSTAAGQEMRPEIAKRIVEAGYDLLEMRPVDLSLEQIFLQLTREQREIDARSQG